MAAARTRARGRGAIVFLTGLFVALQPPAAAWAEPGRWVETRRAGYREYGLADAAGNRIVFACDEIHSLDTPKLTHLRLVVAGHAPPAETVVTIAVRGKSYALRTDTEGAVPTTCDPCAARFAALWKRASRGGLLVASLADGRSATFHAKRAPAVILRKPCTTQYDD